MTDKIIDKIKKCLALASSANEHEAAVALRQAQKLMEQHGVTDQDMLASEAGEAGVKAGAASKPSAWETMLATEVGDAFGCRTLFSNRNGGIWVYIGVGAAPEVCSYAFHVLHRQAKHARADYIANVLKRVKKTAIKTRRADLFSQGWVESATIKLTAWRATPDQEQKVQAFIGVNYPTLSKLKSIDRNADRNLRDHEWNDLGRGQAAGHGAVVNRGVGAGADPLGLEG